MSTNNICFHGEIRKISILFIEKSALSGSMYYSYYVLTLVRLNKLGCHASSNFSQSDYLIKILDINSHR